MSMVIPEDADLVRQLPSPVLYQLEEAGRLATEILDERVAVWTGEGWSQTRIADELGCTQSAISKRLARLGVAAAGPQRKTAQNYSRGIVEPEAEEWDDAEEVDAEPVEHNESGDGGDVAAVYEMAPDAGRKYKTADTFIRRFRRQVAEINPRVGGQINAAPAELKSAWHADVSYVIQQLKQLERALRP